MGQKVTFCVFLLVCVLCGDVFAQPSARVQRQALKELAAATKSGDLSGFLTAIRVVLAAQGTKNMRTAVDAYSELVAAHEDQLSHAEFLSFHGKTASMFRLVKGKKALEELTKLQRKCRDWRGRLLLLDVAAFNEELNLLDAALAALEDPHPIVIRRALRYLSKAKRVPVVDAVVTRFVELEEKPPKRGEKSDYERTLLGFRSALTQLLHVDLPAAVDYKNYFEGRKDDPKLFDPKPADERTELTLFGATVSGKNIIFVFDVSGSMLSTDPLPPEEKKRRQSGRTFVKGQEKRERPRIAEERRRISRAKKELARVVRALPEDVRFNIVFYSSDVSPWKPSMVGATGANKKSAVQFIESVRAEGITVTDLALEEAFADLSLDTIYLVTDGAPTHVGSQGIAEPEDAATIIAAIHKRVKAINFLRGVRIFTLGFRGAKEDFLQKLAKDNFGRYVAIQ